MNSRVKTAKLCSALLCAVLTLGTLCAPVLADFGYSGPLDTVTGEPSQSSDGTDAYSTRVTVSDGVYYDRERLGYLYTVGNTSAQVLCSVADGMVVQDEVRVEPDAGLEVTIYRDGTALEGVDLTHIYEPGGYVVEVNRNGQSYQVIAFVIVGDVTGRLTGYTMPDGFLITDATLNDEPASFDRGYISMTQEGRYVVDYRCARNGLSYQLDVEIDTTPPVLALEAVDESGRARGPVSLEDIEEGASIGITLDGKEIPYAGELTEAGDYRVLVMDEAGNTSEYRFTILLYFNLSSILFMALVVIVAVTVGAYIVISRKRLEVR